MNEMQMDDRVWVGFDLGGTKMNAMLFDSAFGVRGRRRKKSRGSEGVDSGVERIIGSIGKLLEEAQLPKERLGAIGIGCPGPLDLEEGIILEAPNLGWKNVPLKRALE